ncbi:hypothetical protein [Actinomadura sp. 9N407]|uniref:hypothetical protein n=1 Tax=Actinomadura sp. 9N407 TaxID=3375154 RepID=UPI0037A561C7
MRHDPAGQPRPRTPHQRCISVYCLHELRSSLALVACRERGERWHRFAISLDLAFGIDLGCLRTRSQRLGLVPLEQAG